MPAPYGRESRIGFYIKNSMSAVTRPIPFQGSISGKKRVDTYFRKLRHAFWAHVKRVEFKQRLRDNEKSKSYKKSNEVLLGYFNREDGIVSLNTNTKDYGGAHDVGKILLHELLHDIDGVKSPEDVIEKREEHLWKSFSPDQRSYFHVCLFAKLEQPQRGLRVEATIPK